MQCGATLQTSGLAAPVRRAWLDQWQEAPLLADLPVVDAHHHLWDRPGDRYLGRDYLEDAQCGHRIVASVYVEGRWRYTPGGPEAFRPVGEVFFARDVAAGVATQMAGTQLCAAIVGHVDLCLGDRVRPVLEAMERAGGGRFRGIRHVSAWDADPEVSRPIASRPPGLLLDPHFRAGFSLLRTMGCSFDAFVFHPQIAELADLAARFPETSIVLDHCGGPVGIGRYAGRRDEAFQDWRKAVRGIAARENVRVKLSGLGMRMAGMTFHERQSPPRSAELAAAWSPFVETCIEAFGVERCMFASNFPPDKGTCSFGVLWNAFKRMCAGASAEERGSLFYRTAARTYRISTSGSNQTVQLLEPGA